MNTPDDNRKSDDEKVNSRGPFHWPRWVVVGVGMAVLALLTVVAREDNDDPTQRLRVGTASSPSVPTDSDGLTTDVPGEVAHLSSAAGSLSVDLAVQPASAVMGQLVRFTVDLRDAKGGVVVPGVDYGDGSPGAFPNYPAVDCASGSVTTSQASASRRTVTFDHAYRRAGVYEFRFVVASAGCEHRDKTDLRGKIVVADGPLLSNGPKQPLATASQFSTANGQPVDEPDSLEEGASDPATVHLTAFVGDDDGFISRTEIDWGDGSAPSVFDYPLSDCVDPVSHWPHAAHDLNVSHAYASPGAHDVRISATSVGCGGDDRQETNTSLTVASR